MRLPVLLGALGLAVSPLLAGIPAPPNPPRLRLEPSAFVCDRCDKRTLMIDQLEDRTTDHPAAILAAAYSGYSGQAFFDAQSSCVGAVDVRQVVGPPLGEQFNWDYELWGEVTGTSPSYVVRAVLVTASDHEFVAEGRAHIDKPADASSAGAFAVLAVRSGPGGSTSLAQLLDSFEEPRRNSARPAWTAEIEVKEVKNDVSAGETQTIRFELVDCDDRPVEGARVEVRYGGQGSVSAAEVTTDSAGSGSFQYVAPSASARENIYLYWGYKRPSGRLARAFHPECFAVGEMLSLKLDSSISFPTEPDSFGGTVRVTATVPLVGKLESNSWVYRGTGELRYVDHTFVSGPPECTISATVDGAPIGVEVRFSETGGSGIAVRLSVGETTEHITWVCPSGTDHLSMNYWYLWFVYGHGEEYVGSDSIGEVLELRDWGLHPAGDPVFADTIYQRTVDEVNKAVEDTKLTLERGGGGSGRPRGVQR